MGRRCGRRRVLVSELLRFGSWRCRQTLQSPRIRRQRFFGRGPIGDLRQGATHRIVTCRGRGWYVLLPGPRVLRRHRIVSHPARAPEAPHRRKSSAPSSRWKPAQVTTPGNRRSGRGDRHDSPRGRGHGRRRDTRGKRPAVTDACWRALHPAIQAAAIPCTIPVLDTFDDQPLLGVLVSHPTLAVGYGLLGSILVVDAAFIVDHCHGKAGLPGTP